jgi:hypothetical protein
LFAEGDKVMKTKRKHRIKSKFRFCLSMTIMLVIVISIGGNITGQNQALSITKPTYTEVTVIAGDTLWELAKSYGPEGQDIRKIVHTMCKINNVSAERLQPGQKIMIPAYL